MYRLHKKLRREHKKSFSHDSALFELFCAFFPIICIFVLILVVGSIVFFVEALEKARGHEWEYLINTWSKVFTRAYMMCIRTYTNQPLK